MSNRGLEEAWWAGLDYVRCRAVVSFEGVTTTLEDLFGTAPISQADAINKLLVYMAGLGLGQAPEGEEPPLCSVCREPQYLTPGGPTCKNGHGGADPL